MTVSVVAAEPATALVGLRLVNTGTPLLTAKLTGADVPPPGAGFVTVTESVPVAARSAAESWNVSVVAETNVVVCATPLTATAEPCTKLLPVAVTASGPEPIVALEGVRPASTGAGLLTAKGSAADAPPPGGRVIDSELKRACRGEVRRSDGAGKRRSGKHRRRACRSVDQRDRVGREGRRR